mgnify:CR=1 FL=1
MATSSITHNFVISNPNSVKRFVVAIDEADRDCKLRSNRMPVPLLRNGYSIFNGTKYR